VRKEAEPAVAEALLGKAYQGGATVLGPGHVAWNIAGRCANPKGVEVTSRAFTLLGERKNTWVEMQVRCRRCPACLRHKASEWRTRSQIEVLAWPRSYLGTLTLSPEEQYRALAEASSRLAASAVDFDRLSDREQFAERCQTIGVWLQRYLKRCRWEMGIRARYLLVAERHKSGLPHFHLLFHEVDPYTHDQWDTYCVLKSQWPHGHSDFQGISPGDLGACRYVTKYITKSAETRVRASARYGRLSDQGQTNETVENTGTAVNNRSDSVKCGPPNPLPEKVGAGVEV